MNDNNPIPTHNFKVDDPNTYQLPSSQLYQRVSHLRWLVLVLGLTLVVVHLLLEEYVGWASLRHWELVEIAYGSTIAVVAWGFLTWLQRSVGQTKAAEYAAHRAHTEMSQTNQRLKFLIQVNHHLINIGDEEILIDRLLESFMQTVSAIGCSLIRFNEHGHALPVIYRGGLDPATFETWADHLSAAGVRQRCQACVHRWPEGAVACPLFIPPSTTMDVRRIYCLELARGDQLYGILSLYLPDAGPLDDQEKMLLDMMVNEVVLALESHALRSRELAMLNRLQGSHRLHNLHDELAGALAHTVEALEADGGVLFLCEIDSAEFHVQAEVGRPLGDALELVQGLASGAGQAKTSLVIRDLEQIEQSEIRSLLIAPLHIDDHVLGNLTLWAAQPDIFTCHRAQLVATVAGQAALLIENHRLYLHGEHRAALAERARLAREIHDNLAQTLGYLKLRTNQITNQLQHGNYEPAIADLAEVRQLLNEAYIDAREAIDGLRLKANCDDLPGWVNEVVSEFETLSNIVVENNSPPDLSLPQEVHTQLQRIVQEAFSNIRKHADATRVRLEWQINEYWLTLQITDNGRGFNPDDILPVARHGLSIMRERAELLDADFQISSQPDQGARITIRLPLQNHIGEV